MLGVSGNKLAAIERRTGLLSPLEASGQIGAGLYLASVSEARLLYARAGNSRPHHGWETPAALLIKVLDFVGAK